MEETERMLNKKLRRIFLFLDDDMDGKVSSDAVIMCLKKLHLCRPPQPKGLEKMKSNVQNLMANVPALKQQKSALLSTSLEPKEVSEVPTSDPPTPHHSTEDGSKEKE